MSSSASPHPSHFPISSRFLRSLPGFPIRPIDHPSPTEKNLVKFVFDSYNLDRLRKAAPRPRTPRFLTLFFLSPLNFSISAPTEVNSALKERRRSKRAHVNLTARWEGVLSQMTGTVTDISVGGCFVLTEDRVQLNELIRLELQLLGGKSISIWGEIVYRAPDIASVCDLLVAVKKSKPL